MVCVVYEGSMVDVAQFFFGFSLAGLTITKQAYLVQTLLVYKQSRSA